MYNLRCSLLKCVTTAIMYAAIASSYINCCSWRAPRIIRHYSRIWSFISMILQLIICLYILQFNIIDFRSRCLMLDYWLLIPFCSFKQTWKKYYNSFHKKKKIKLKIYGNTTLQQYDRADTILLRKFHNNTYDYFQYNIILPICTIFKHL